VIASRPASGSGPSRGRAAARSPRAVTVFLVLVGVSLAGDLLSKHLVFRRTLDAPATRRRLQARADIARGDEKPSRALLRQVPSRRLLPGVRITLSTNPGGVFGLALPRWVIAVTTVAVIALVGYFFAASPAGSWGLHAALALILSGALGNLYDRLLGEVALPVAGFAPIRGQVRDFIDCSALHYPWVFNVADVLLVVGGGVLVLHWLRQGRRGAARRPRG